MNINKERAISLSLPPSPASNKDTIVQAKALQPLISLLSSDSAEVQCNACGCITTLATTGMSTYSISVAFCVCVCVCACVFVCMIKIVV